MTPESKGHRKIQNKIAKEVIMQIIIIINPRKNKTNLKCLCNPRMSCTSAHLTTTNLNPKNTKQNFKVEKNTRYMAYRWQERSVHELKLGTRQVKK
jgi:hypothetical protein